MSNEDPKNKLKTYSFARIEEFKGERRVGLDACILIGIIVSPYYYEFIKGELPIESFLFIHQICLQETLDVLCKDFGYNRDDALNQVRQKIKELGIEKVELNEENQNFAEEILKEAVKKSIPLNEPDNVWIVDLIKDKKVNLVISQDGAVEKTCKKILNINARKVPHQDNAPPMNREVIGDFFKSVRKFGRKKK